MREIRTDPAVIALREAVMAKLRTDARVPRTDVRSPTSSADEDIDEEEAM